MKHIDESVQQHTPVNKCKWKEVLKSRMVSESPTPSTPKRSTTPTDFSSETDNSSSSAPSPQDEYIRSKKSCVLNVSTSNIPSSSFSVKKIYSKRNFRTAIVDQRRRNRQHSRRSSYSPDRAYSAPPRRRNSRESSSSVEHFSDNGPFDGSSELRPSPSRFPGLPSTLGEYTCLPPSYRTIRNLKDKSSTPVLTPDSPLPVPQSSLSVSCEKPQLKPIQPLDLEPEARTP
ncbi:unnamed protein product [Schistocephalus solidus]|uniref:SRRM_C domain-containing protein n=1 Tax=Schistocephalus solidus TaxID=70667 RepID=A0A183SJU1_SCHSO|nr:unnamed protein product [Schistocephalus solidus]